MSNINNPFPLPNVVNYQSDPKKVHDAIACIEQKARDTKRIMEELLYMLDLQEKVPWPDMLEKFSAIAASHTQIQALLRKSGVQAGMEDQGAMLRCHVLVPQHLQLEPDPQLQEMSNYRVHSWNHDIVPDYLRTKPTPDIESEEITLENEKNLKGHDLAQRQINNVNKHVDILMVSTPVAERNAADLMDKPQHSHDETVKLVRAIMCGETLKSNPPSRQMHPQQAQQQQHQHMNPQGSRGHAMGYMQGRQM